MDRGNRYAALFGETVGAVQHPVTRDMIPLETPMYCETIDDLAWLLRGWEAVFSLDWKISRIPYEPPASRSNPDLIGYLEI